MQITSTKRSAPADASDTGVVPNQQQGSLVQRHVQIEARAAAPDSSSGADHAKWVGDRQEHVLQHSLEGGTVARQGARVEVKGAGNVCRRASRGLKLVAEGDLPGGPGVAAAVLSGAAAPGQLVACSTLFSASGSRRPGPVH